MGRSYTVNRSPKRPSQFPYICSLLVFLVFLLLIYLLSYFLKSTAGNRDQGGTAIGSHATNKQTTKSSAEQSVSTHSSGVFESSSFTSSTVEPEVILNTKKVQDVEVVQTTQNESVMLTTSPSTTTRVVDVTGISDVTEVKFPTKNDNITENPIIQGSVNNASMTNMSSDTQTTGGTTFGEMSTTKDTKIQNNTELLTTQKSLVPELVTSSSTNVTTVTQGTTTTENINIVPLLPITTLNTSALTESTVHPTTWKTEMFNATATPFTTTARNPTQPVKFLRIVSEGRNEVFLTKSSTTHTPSYMITRFATKLKPEATSTITERPLHVFLVNNSTISSPSYMITRVTTELKPVATPTVTEVPLHRNKDFLTNSSTRSSPSYMITRLMTKSKLETAPTVSEVPLHRHEVFLVNNSTTSSPITRLTTKSELNTAITNTEKPFKFEENTTYLSRIVTSPWTTKYRMLTNRNFGSKNVDTNAVCEIPECKKLAAEMLVLQNHDVAPCDEFYNYACGGRTPLGHTPQHDRIKKRLLNAIHLDSNVPEIFRKFYFQCRNFNLDFYFLERERGVDEYGADATELFVELTLLQTLHFFDVTLGIGEGSNIIIEITPANLFPLHVLKTTIDRFSVFEYFRNKCVDLEKFPPAINGTTKSSVITCVFDKMTAYVRRYCKEKSCEVNILNVLLELLDFQKQYINIETIEMDHSFKKIRHLPRNKIGMDWLKYFQALFTDVTEDTMVLVNDVEYFDELWKKFDGHSVSIRKALLLWHNIQSYKRTMNILNDNNEDSCLDMSIELMPDIGTFLVHGQTKNTKYKIDEIIFAPLVQTLASCIAGENLKAEYRSSLLMKLSNIKLQSTVATNYQVGNYRRLHLEVSEEHSQYSMVQIMLRNYRKMVYSLAGATISPRILLAFFVNPLDTKPKAFLNTNYIVYHPQFATEYSPSLPLLIQLAKYGYPLSRELWKMLLNYESDGDTYTFSLKSHDPIMYKSLTRSLFINEPLASESPIQETMGNQLIIENAAFRLLTETYEVFPMKRDSLVYMNFTHTVPEIYTLAAVQGLCTEEQPGKLISDISKDAIPFKMIAENIVMNSKFFFNTFHCDDDHAYFNAQFPFVRTTDPDAIGVED